MGIFKSSGRASDVPLDAVLSMRSQGLANSQIIQTLQRDGYSSSQIFDAISQSEMATGQSMNMSSSNPETMQLGSQLPPMQQQNSMMSGMSQGMSMQSSPMQSQMSSSSMSGLQSSPEELVEAIIDEKWNDLVKDINKIVDWKQKVDSKLSGMDQKISDLQVQIDKLQQAVLGKINDYDKNILDVGTQLSAMEKVFSKTIPTLIENVNALDNITQRVRNSSDAPVRARVSRVKNIDKSVKVVEEKNEQTKS
jgi:prefoldin subunit 5